MTVTDPDAVSHRNVALAGNLSVSGVPVGVADGATVKKHGRQRQPDGRHTAAFSYPLAPLRAEGPAGGRRHHRRVGRGDGQEHHPDQFGQHQQDGRDEGGAGHPGGGPAGDERGRRPAERGREPDIVLGASGRPSRVFRSGPGGPAYADPGADLGPAADTRGVTVADAGGDGRGDVVFAARGVSRLFRGTAGGTFAVADLYADGSEAPTVNGVAAADLTGDGRPDPAVVGTDPPTQVYVNDGTARPYTETTARVVSLDPTLTSAVSQGLIDS